MVDHANCKRVGIFALPIAPIDTSMLCCSGLIQFQRHLAFLMVSNVILLVDLQFHM